MRMHSQPCKNPFKGGSELKRVALFLTFLLCLLAPVSAGSCSARYEVTEEQLTTLETNLTALQQDNERLRALLIESQTELTQARTQLKASQAECQTLSTQLMQLKETSTKARESLQTAQDATRSAQESLTKSEREHARAEERLRTQKTAWQIVSGSLLLAVIF